MQVSALDAATTTRQNINPTGRGMESLKSEDFFRLLVTELQNQDPFKPAETADMISQVSQIRSIELSQGLTDALSQLTDQQHVAGVSELLGKYVQAQIENADGEPQTVDGIVTGLRFGSDGRTILELDTGQTVLAEDVTRVAGPDTMDTLQQSTASNEQVGHNQNDADQDETQTDKSDQTSKGLLPWLADLFNLG